MNTTPGTGNVPTTVHDAMALIEALRETKLGSPEAARALSAMLYAWDRWNAAGQPGVEVSLTIEREEEDDPLRLFKSPFLAPTFSAPTVHIEVIDRNNVRWIIDTPHATVERVDP